MNPLHPGNPQNNEEPKVPANHSYFPLQYHLLDTERFGEVSCPFITEVVPDDVIKLHCPTQVQTLSLKSPLMANLSKKRDYFSVPLAAILPNNWEKVYTNPTIGDDVPDDVNCVIVSGFGDKVSNLFDTFVDSFHSSWASGQPTSLVFAIANFFRCLIVGEYFYSNGSLLNQLGYKLSAGFKATFTDNGVKYTEVSFDKFFDYFIASFMSEMDEDDYIGIRFGTLTDHTDYMLVKDPQHIPSGADSTPLISIRRFLEMARDEPTFSVLASTLDAQKIDPCLDAFDRVTFDYSDYGSLPFNFGRLAAYQICCHHYYSNDHVDYIYSAELYRQLMGSYCMDFLAAGSTSTDDSSFTLNGVKYQYDFLSGFMLGYALTSTHSSALSYIAGLFSFRHSLRYEDYFTGARTRPLAVGDVNVDVNNGKVNVIDFAQRSQFARFLNAVNRSGRKIANYIANLFPGAQPSYDYHNPLYLGHTSDEVRSSETENTGAAQWDQHNSVTSRLYQSSDQFGFEYKAEMPGYVLCLSYYDMPRIYAKTIERSMFHIDRFDMFNPFMQFVGDQMIYGPELQPSSFEGAPFAYTLRHMEYKQKFSQATGGFVEALPTWAFLADNVPGLPVPAKLGPSYIRSSNVELDRFFVKGISGYSLGTYFHFIVMNNNDCSGVRPMVKSPQIM